MAQDLDEASIERHDRAFRPYALKTQLFDPYTWPYSLKYASIYVSLGLCGLYLVNLWYKKPWYSSAVPRLALLTITGILGASVGKIRERNYQLRDAIVEHYVQLHPEDFAHFDNHNGRKYNEILLPWYPNRVTERKN